MRQMRRMQKRKRSAQICPKLHALPNRSIASYDGHLGHGHTHKLRKKVMGDFVLRRGEPQARPSDRYVAESYSSECGCGRLLSIYLLNQTPYL